MVALDPLTRQSIDLFLTKVRARFPIKEAWLYGSVARGTATKDSDIDVALVLEEHVERDRPLVNGIYDEAYDVLLATGNYLSPLPIAAKDWRDPTHFSNPLLLENIRREGLPV